MENKNNIALNIENLLFAYKEKENVISNINLQVEQGSFTTLLGPSGCGKTTLLRLISGFLEPTSGKIEIDGINQKKIAPDKRKIGMVFQDYALFPHMNVRKNIAYGINIQRQKTKINKNEIEQKILDICNTLKIADLLDRFPNELSGGQQQRVALARGLVLNPKLLLMDEPLSSLDTKLREAVREELKEIQQRLKITTIYVTHDQEEALSLSDNIAVMNKGIILQCGSPRDVYFKPSDEFTADFVGQANIIDNKSEKIMIRPEWFTINSTNQKGEYEGTVISSAFLGDRTRFKIQLDNEQIITADLKTLDSNSLERGRKVSLIVSHKWKF